MTGWLLDNHSDQLMLMKQGVVEVVYLTWYLYTLVIKDRSSGRQVEWIGKHVHMIFVIFFVIFFSTGEDIMKIFDESSKILSGM